MLVEQLDRIEDFLSLSNHTYPIHYTVSLPKVDNKDTPTKVGFAVTYTAINSNPNITLCTCSTTYIEPISSLKDIDTAIANLKASLDKDIQYLISKHKVDLRPGSYVSV